MKQEPSKKKGPKGKISNSKFLLDAEQSVSIYSAEPVSHMTRHELTLEKAQRGLMGRPQLVNKTI